MKQKRTRVLISGLVQGVNFRYFTRRTAEQFNVKGWVRNLPGGEVEGLFEGRESDLRRLIEWCQEGPAAAQVDSVAIDWEEAKGEFSTFEVLR